MSDLQNIILQKVKAERDRQDARWGHPQYNSFAEWGIILTEELGEVVQVINELHFRPQETASQKVVRRDHLKAELIQLAAVAVSMVEHIESGVLK